MMGPTIALLMFPAAILSVLIGYPVAFTLAGISLIFACIGYFLGVFDPSLLTALPVRYFGIMTNEVLVAVPLFVFMGVMLERSKISEELLTTMSELLGGIRGGLGVSVIIVGALIAASTGIVGATVVTMGLLSLPVMTKAGYSPSLSSGTICASGTLGQIIPPSTVLIFMAEILQGANQKAQLEMGNFSPEPLSVGQLFAGAMIPGLILVGLYIAWVITIAIIIPEACPPVNLSKRQKSELPRKIVFALFPPLLLIVLVLGSILTGLATPTESASVGAIGAMFLAGIKNKLSLKNLREVMRSTLLINSMVFIILLGASVFSLVFRGLNGEEMVYELLSNVPGGKEGALLVVMLTVFFLGFFLDTFEIIFITIPIAAPVLIRLGIDPIYLGVLIGMNLQTSFLTPPFGFSLFYLRGVANKILKTVEIYKGVLPFVALQILGIIIVFNFPSIATWLPDILFGNNFEISSSNLIEDINNKNDEDIGILDNFRNLFNTNYDRSVSPLDKFKNIFD